MDLLQLGTRKKSNEGVFMHLRHPDTGDLLLDNDGEAIGITLTGMDGDIFREAMLKQRREWLKKSKSSRLSPADADFEVETVETLARCTLGWSGIGLGSEQSLEFTFENVLRVYSDPDVRWLREQVDLFIADRANFLQASATT